MPPRRKKQVQQKTEELNQDPVQRLVKLIVDAFEGGIKEFKEECQKRNTNTKKEIIPKEEGWVNQPQAMKEPYMEEGSSGSSKNFKRKWREDKYEPEGSQSKKKKVGACSNCGKNHSGVCLKGKNRCYRCGQEGHIAPNCPKPKKSRGCFKCGSIEHQIKNCPKKEAAGGRSDPTGHEPITEK